MKYLITILVFVASVLIQSSLEAGPGTISNGSVIRITRIAVNSTLDELNNGDGNCTLREAITNVNDGAQTYSDCLAPSTFGRPTIDLPAGDYCLTEQPPAITWDGGRADDDDDNAYGDLDIKASVIIKGASSSTTIIDGGAASDSSSRGCTTVMDLRAFQVHSGTVTFEDLEITGSGTRDDDGGGIYAESTVTSLTLNNVKITENESLYGSAVYFYASGTSPASVHILNSDFSRNHIGYGGTVLLSSLDSVEIENSTFSDNEDSLALSLHGIYSSVTADTTVTIKASTFSNNGTGIEANVNDGNLEIINSTISNNSYSGVRINNRASSSENVNIFSSTIAQNEQEFLC